MSERRRRPSEVRRPDIEIGAAVRARSLRFDRKPKARVEFSGRPAEQDSSDERVNLPGRVEAGRTYRDVRVRWRAAAWAGEIEDEDLAAPGSGMSDS